MGKNRILTIILFIILLNIETIIMRLSLLGSILFMIAEGIMAYVTHSHSILIDCIFDVTDLIMVGPFLVLIPLLYKPVTEKRPYGFSQVESLFVVIKYSVLLVITVQLMWDSINVYNFLCNTSFIWKKIFINDGRCRTLHMEA